MSLLQTVKESKLVKSSFWYTIGNVFIKGVNFVTIPIYTNIMTVREYGLINNFLAIVTIVSIFIGLSLNGSINNANFEFKGKMEEYMSSVLFLSSLAFTGFFIIGNLAYLFNDTYFSINHIVFFFLIIQAYANFLVQYLSSYFTINVQYFKFLGLSFLNILLNVGFSLFFMLTVFTDDRYFGRVVGSTIGLGLLSLAIYLLILLKGKS